MLNKFNQSVIKLNWLLIATANCFCLLPWGPTLVVAELSIDTNLSAELSLTEQYKLIEEYLSRNLPNNDEAKKNFAILDKWLGKGGCDGLLKLIGFKQIIAAKQSDQIKLRSAYNQLNQLKLKAGEDVDWCFELGVDLTNSLLKVTKGLHRLRSIIGQLLEYHLDECQPAFISRACKLFNGEQMNYIIEATNVIGQLVTGVLFGKSQSFLLDSIIKNRNSETNIYTDIIDTIHHDDEIDWAKLMFKTKNNFFQQMRIAFEKSKRPYPRNRFDLMIIEPCRKFIELVDETKVFALPTLIVGNFAKRKQIHFDEDDDIANPVYAKSFYQKWMNERICREIILKNPANLVKDLKLRAETKAKKEKSKQWE